jgi:oxygen-independent coproporphyrinogen-3 oxidase
MDGSTSALLGTRYPNLARNTIDYWLTPGEPRMTAATIAEAWRTAPVLPGATLSLYVHVPFCGQRCRFCAFSGGNAPTTKHLDRYVRLLALQLQDLVARCPMAGRPIRAVNIGGGSPDLLGPAIVPLLHAVQRLPGYDDDTELAVEMTASTTPRAFVDALVAHGVHKASLGIQSRDPSVRGFMRQPRSTVHVDRLLGWLAGRVPIVNVDLITGLPGQTLASVEADVRALVDDPRVSAISSYLLTPAAAPSLLAAAGDGTIPNPPPAIDQALMRLATYGAFRRAGWVRRGTNTYVDPARCTDADLERLAGHECIGAGHYEAFLVGAGPQAVSSVPGARVENIVDVAKWCDAIERGDDPFFLTKCSTTHQRDMALWTFPLRFEGLPAARLRAMEATGVLSSGQRQTLQDFEHEGLVHRGTHGLSLTLLGEVFMGHLVRDLKSDASRRAVDAHVAQGRFLAAAVVDGRARDDNRLNNRQVALRLVGESPTRP